MSILWSQSLTWRSRVLYLSFKEVKVLHKSLTRWPIIPISYALQLLDHSFPDMRYNSFNKNYSQFFFIFRVSEFAIKCLEVESDETIEMFFFQLVQALKHQNYYSNPLCKFLLKRALNNRRLGQKVVSYTKIYYKL